MKRAAKFSSAKIPKRACTSLTAPDPLPELPPVLWDRVFACMDKDSILSTRGACKNLSKCRVPLPNICRAFDDAGLAKTIDLCVPQLVKKARGFDDLTDAGMALFAQLTNLESLDLSGCDLPTSESLGHLKPLGNLKYLDLSRWKLYATGLLHLVGLPLETLILSDCNPLASGGLGYLQQFAKLRHLDISSCRIEDQGLADISQVINLTHLSLGYLLCITDAGIEHLLDLTNLKMLRIESCNGMTNASLPHIARMTNLTDLQLVNSQVTNLIPLHTAPIKSFTLESCKFVSFVQLQNLVVACGLRVLNPSYSVNCTGGCLLTILPNTPTLKKLVLRDWWMFDPSIQAEFDQILLEIEKE